MWQKFHSELAEGGGSAYALPSPAWLSAFRPISNKNPIAPSLGILESLFLKTNELEGPLLLQMAGAAFEDKRANGYLS